MSNLRKFNPLFWYCYSYFFFFFTLLKDVPLLWFPEFLVKSLWMSRAVPALGKGVFTVVVFLLFLLFPFGHALSLDRTRDFQSPFVSSSRRHISTLPSVQPEGLSLLVSQLGVVRILISG